MNVLTCRDGSFAGRRRYLKPQEAGKSSAQHATHNSWLIENCFSDKSDIIDRAKYDTSDQSLDVAPLESSLVENNSSRKCNISLIDHNEQQKSSTLSADLSAILQDDHIDCGCKKSVTNKNRTTLTTRAYEKKESSIFKRKFSISLLLFVLAGLSIRQDAVSCLDFVSGISDILNYRNIPHNYPIQPSSTHRNMNTNPTFWMTGPTNNPALFNHNVALFTANSSDDMSTSAAESFYPDQNNLAAQSSAAPVVANGWISPNVPPSDSLNDHIKNILVPRVSGTPGNVRVRQYIMESLEANDYTVQLDEFTDNTPVGKVRFANIIAHSDPNACRQLVLACHYDSKMMDGFLGAVDSAVPCAMLLKMSETFKTAFRAEDGAQFNSNSLGLQFIFFDGEEAFHEWGPTDSLYGSRHLAAKWEKQSAPKGCSGRSNELSRIELLVLLDLIGSKDTSFVMFTGYDPAANRRIQAHHNNFRKYERAYLTGQLGGGLTMAQANQASAFRSRQVPIYLVEDDHVPFMKRGVPILSLLASPFPKVWHTVADNYEAIDFERTRRILHVLEQWLANYEQKPSA